LTVNSVPTSDVIDRTTNVVELCCLEDQEVCFEFQSFTNVTCTSQNGREFNPTFSENVFQQTCQAFNCSLNPSSNFDDDGMTHQISRGNLFLHYLFVRLVLDVLKSASMSLVDGAAIAIIQDQKGDIGLQKLFGTIGAIICGPIAGKSNALSLFLFLSFSLSFYLYLSLSLFLSLSLPLSHFHLNSLCLYLFHSRSKSLYLSYSFSFYFNSSHSLSHILFNFLSSSVVFLFFLNDTWYTGILMIVRLSVHFQILLSVCLSICCIKSFYS
jgi:hypothetical protein